MRFDPMSRRHFLCGAGASLLLPQLFSLGPRARAAVPPVRYVQFMSPYGLPGASFYPSDQGLVRSASGVFARPLQEQSGSISPQFDQSFDSFKQKLSLVRGLSVLPKGGVGEQHNASYPGCASMVDNHNDPNTNDNYPGFYPFTLDAVLAASDKIYPGAPQGPRHVNITPGYSQGSRSNFSWARINGKIQHVANTTASSALAAKFPQLSAAMLPPAPAGAPDPALARKRDVLHHVYEDYRALRTSPRLSDDDRMRLESYISLIDGLQKGLEAETGGGMSDGAPRCLDPGLEADAAGDARSRNQLRLIAAALACQLTRVVSVTLIRPQDNDGSGHTIHHDAADSAVAAFEAPSTRLVGFFLGLLDQIDEGNGTLLDNSLVFYTLEFGERYPGNMPGHIHVHKDMTVMLAGGAQGALQMGQYIDYRKSGGRPYNNLLVTLYNAMGLGSRDYEREGLVGIGDYDPALVSSFGFEPHVSDAEKRKPLPYLFKGTPLG